MRVIYIIILSVLILTGCTSNSDTIEIAEHNKEIETLETSYEQKIQDLRTTYEEQIKELKSTNSSDQGEKQIDNSNIGELEKKLEEYNSEFIKMKRILFNKTEDTNSLYDDIYLEDKVVKLHSEGTDILEDGIICVLEVFDYNKNIIWSVSWEGLDVSELSAYSPVTVFKDRIYIVVGGELNVIDINTGQILWEPVFVGSPNHPPRVSEDGYIYVTGQYGPFLTAVNKDGTVEWQIESQEMSWSSDVAVCNEYILVEWIGGIAVFDKDGIIFE